jgi:hypothetical protein
MFILAYACPLLLILFDLQQCKEPACGRNQPCLIHQAIIHALFWYCFHMISRTIFISKQLLTLLHEMHQLHRQLQGPALRPHRQRTLQPTPLRSGGVAPRIALVKSRTADVEYAGEGISAEQVAKFDAIAARLVDAADRLPDNGEYLSMLSNIVVSKGFLSEVHVARTDQHNSCLFADFEEGDGLLPFGASPAEVEAFQAAQRRRQQEQAQASSSGSASQAGGFAEGGSKRRQRRIPDEFLPKVHALHSYCHGCQLAHGYMCQLQLQNANHAWSNMTVRC